MTEPAPDRAVVPSGHEGVGLRDFAEAERAVLGCCYLGAKMCAEVMGALTPAHFGEGANRAVFLAMRITPTDGGIPDFALVASELRKMNRSDVFARLAEVAAWPTAANFDLYLARVQEGHRHREVNALTWSLNCAHSLGEKLSIVGRLQELHQAAVRVTAPTFAPVGAFDLLETALPAIEELVEGRVVYRGGVTLLVSSHKRGKSLAALGLALDLVLNLTMSDLSGPRNATWLGLRVVGSGPVLVYSAEGGEIMLQERIRKMAGGLGSQINKLHVYAKKPTPQLDNEAHLDAVFAQAEAVGAVLLVFDPLGRFWSMADEKDPTAMRNLMEAIQTRAQAAYGGRGIAVLLIHHDTKASGSETEGPVTGGRGSGKLGDDADALINFRWVKDGSPGESDVHFLLRHGESPHPRRVYIDGATLTLRVDETVESTKPSRAGRPSKVSAEAVAELLKKRGTLSLRAVPGLLQCSPGTWWNKSKDIVREMVEQGCASLDETGKDGPALTWEGEHS